MQTRIRKATPNDLDAINHIFYLSKKSWGYDEAFMQECRNDYSLTLDNIKRSVYLFYVESKLAGFYYFDHDTLSEVELDYFFLHPDFFGKGFGRQLWNACVKTARELGIKQFILQSDAFAEGFYRHMGCQKIGEEASPMVTDERLPIFIYVIND